MKTDAPSLLDRLAPLDADGLPVDLRTARLLARLPKRHLPEYQALVREAEAKLPDWQRAILERIEGAVGSPLTAGDCWYIAEALREHWRPRDYGKFDRLHHLVFAEEMHLHAKWPYVAELYGKSVKTLGQWVRRSQAWRKKLRR